MNSFQRHLPCCRGLDAPDSKGRPAAAGLEDLGWWDRDSGVAGAESGWRDGGKRTVPVEEAAGVADAGTGEPGQDDAAVAAAVAVGLLHQVENGEENGDVDADAGGVEGEGGPGSWSGDDASGELASLQPFSFCFFFPDRMR